MANFSNVSSDDDALTKLTAFLDLNGRAEGIALLTTMAIFCLVGVTGNSVALSVFCSRLKRTARVPLRSRYNVFTCALAALDLFVSAVWIPCDVLLTLRMINHDILCSAIGFLAHAAVIFASLIHFCICLERYYAVCKPLHPFTALHVRVMMCSIALVSIGLSVPSVFAYSVYNPMLGESPTGCHYQRDTLLGRYYNMVLGAVLSALVIVVLATYGVIFRLIVKRVLMKSGSTCSWPAEAQSDVNFSNMSPDFTTQLSGVESKRRRSTAQVKQTISSSSRLAFMFFAVTLFFYLCWLPYFLIALGIIASDIFLANIHFLTNCSSFIVYLVFTRRTRHDQKESTTLDRQQPRGVTSDA